MTLKVFPSSHRVPAQPSKRIALLLKVEAKLAHHELKEATTVIELALWKNKMIDQCQGERRCSKRRKVGESNLRKQCRVSCGADIVIQHMLPYLLPPKLETSTAANNESNDGSD